MSHWAALRLQSLAKHENLNAEPRRDQMPAFFRKDTPGYWSRYPEHLKDMDQVMDRAGLTPATLHVLGEPTDESAPAALIFTMPPHAVISRHAHECERFEVILEGSLVVEDDASGEMVLGPGDIMVARPGEPYGPHTAGPEGCRTLEVFGTLRGAHSLLYETADGPLAVDFGSLESLAKLGRGRETG
jgi:mannose-6-phosphate isomerase-like protein (cupin superfamily)